MWIRCLEQILFQHTVHVRSQARKEYIVELSILAESFLSFLVVCVNQAGREAEWRALRSKLKLSLHCTAETINEFEGGCGKE